VSMLDQLGVVSHLCFGSECGDILSLQQTAKLLHDEPPVLSERIRECIRQGLTYPQAREQAVLEYLNTLNEAVDADAQRTILSSPNNILGVEYCKAILRRGSTMFPVTVTRKGHGYHDTALDMEFSSATAIREELRRLFSGDTDSSALEGGPAESVLLKQIPDCVKPILADAKPLFTDDLSALLSYRLLELQARGCRFDQYFDVPGDLAERIQNQLLEYTSFDDKAALLKTRQFTYTRISRCLMHILLQMTQEEYAARKAQGYISYIRILGFRRQSADILSTIKKNCPLPLITKTADTSKRLDPVAYQQFQHDLFCSHVYQSVYSQKYKEQVRNEFTQPLILL